MCPASSTRRSRPRPVRASTASPDRSTSRCGACARSAASSASASVALGPGDAGHVDQRGGQVDGVGGEVESGHDRRRYRGDRRLPSASPVRGTRPRIADALGVAAPASGDLVSCGKRPPDNVVAREHRAPRGRFRHRTGHRDRRRHGARHLVPRAGPRPRRTGHPGRPSSRSTGADRHRGTRTTVVRTTIGSLADPPVDASDVYLRLHLLSHRLVAPHEINLDGSLRAARQRRLDQPRAVPGPRVRAHPGPAAQPRPGHRVRGGQVPPDGRLRRPERRPDRRRRPRPAGRAPGRGHHRDARGLRQLQRGHARHVHGRGPHLGGGRRR